MQRRGYFNLNQILAIGDHPDDYLAAHGAGIKFVGVLTGIYDRDDFSQHGLSPEEVIESVASLPEYLKRIEE
jgi:phosphoglycolate phosphatase-like HAD superfamily hydrolase